jgi:hypothetical protein
MVLDLSSHEAASEQVNDRPVVIPLEGLREQTADAHILREEEVPTTRETSNV